MTHNLKQRWAALALLAATLVLTACAGYKPIIACTDAKSCAMESVAQAEASLIRAWAELGDQARQGILLKSEVQAIEKQLDDAGERLDKAHVALRSGLWDLANGKAATSEQLLDAVHAKLGEYLKESRRKKGGGS
jgi:cellobiose-specific phosphotransferase system component IIA